MLTVAFELIGLTSSLLAIVWLLRGPASGPEPVGRDARWVLAAIVLLSLFFHLGNVLEWGGVTSALDPVEDFLWVLMPVLWAFFFYVSGQEFLHARLRDSEERYRGLVELSPEAIFVHRNGELLYANPAAERFVGSTSSNELLGRQIEDVFPAFGPISPASPTASFERSLGGEEGTRDVEITSSAIEFLGLDARQVIVHDITARKAVERQLKTGARVLESMVEGVCLAEDSGEILYANAAQEAMFGCAPGELVGANVWALHMRAGEDDDLERMRQKLRRRGHWSGELVNRRKDGTTYATHARITALDLEGRRAWLCVAQDLSERKRLEDQLVQAHKMESVGRLAGGIAHDFNNILTVVVGSIEMARRKAANPEELRVPLDRVREAANRASELIRQLLGYARKQVYSPTVLNLGDLLVGAEEMLGRLIGEHIALRTSVVPELWNVRADPSQLMQVVVNLAVNARDAMPGGGELVIEARNRTPKADAVPFPVPDDEFVSLSVRDNGPGMSEEVKRHVFEPFFTTKEPGAGTGLGLATCYGIVKQNGGFIAVESDPGRGSTFTVYLPRAAGDAEAIEEATASSKLPPGRECVLVVEDEDSVRSIAVDVLDELGYEVLQAKDGAEAIRIAASSEQQLDLLITDIVMPQMGGTALARALRLGNPGLRVLFISGYASNDKTLEGALDAGDVLLLKPFTPAELAQRVRDVLDLGRARAAGSSRTSAET